MLHPHQHATIAAFELTASQYASTIGALSNYDSSYAALLELLHENDAVLDLACGPGNAGKFLRDHKQLSITGYDMSEAMLELARRNVPDGHFEKRSMLDMDAKKSFHAIVNAFGLPFLDKAQRPLCFAACARALQNQGLMYLSFMEGEHEGFEKTSFSPEREIYFHYHRKAQVLEELRDLGFSLIQEWELDFDIGDKGSLKDVVLIFRHTSPNS